jgi:hypothetical protein
VHERLAQKDLLPGAGGGLHVGIDRLLKSDEIVVDGSLPEFYLVTQLAHEMLHQAREPFLKPCGVAGGDKSAREADY